MNVEEFKQALQVAAMAHSPDGFERVKQIDKQALCLLPQADYLKVAPLVLYIFREAWTGKIDYQVTMPDALPEHWLSEVTTGAPETRMVSTFEWNNWRERYYCPEVPSTEVPSADVASSEKKEPAKPPKRNDKKSSEPSAETKCVELGGAWDAGAKVCNRAPPRRDDVAQEDLDEGAPVETTRSPWTIALIAAGGIGLVAGIVYLVRRKK